MPALPSGTVTFLFTDIEGSTVRWELDPGGMSEALAEHDLVLRSTIETNGGTVFSTGGDGFAAAFGDAASALNAAAEAQERLRLPVRMGLHTGTAVEREGNYFGRTLNRAARIMSAGHAGQVVLSDVTAGLIRDETYVTDLGEHRLAGVERAMRLWQLGGREFAPLRTSTVVAGNLPVPLDSFIGRSQELRALAELMSTHRLVTVVGVGGMGKTRLVIEASHSEQWDFEGGEWFVDLSLAASESAVAEQAASVFGLQAAPSRSIEDRLIEYLKPRTALLVFDNCEHVMRPAAGLIDRLLRSCPTLKILATSREALMLRGERVMPLGPLSIDEETADASMTDAAALFVDRLTAEGGLADVDDDDRAVALEICRQLDGMPLAIELAAARARTLGPSGVLSRLGERLRLLSGGWRTGAGRQQTLSATFDWSYVLLDEHEQIVFDRLSVFVGWFTADDAAVVAAGSSLGALDVLDALSGLVDKSMCTVDLEATPARYRYLETMRSYGRDHLGSSATLTECRDRHAAHMAGSARAVTETLVGPDKLDAARRAERLVPDLRAALGWAVDRQLVDVITGIASLAVLMGVRGSHEVNGWFYDLRHDLPDHPSVQEAAMYHAFYSRADHPETRRLAHRLIETMSDTPSIAWDCLAMVEWNEGHFERGLEFRMRGHEIAEARTGSRFVQIVSPLLLSNFLAGTGRNADELVEQGFDRARDAGWPSGLAFAHFAAGLAIMDTDPAASLEQLNRGLALAVEVGSGAMEAICQTLVTHLQSAVLPPCDLARALIRQLRHLQERGETSTALHVLSQVFVLLSHAERPRSAALICGWLGGRTGRNVQTIGEHEAAVASVRGVLGDQWDPLFQQGRSMTTTQIFETACEELETIEESVPWRGGV